MTNNIAQKLGSAGLSNSGKFMAGTLVGANMSKNAMLATVLFGNSVGSSNWMNSEIKLALLSGQTNRLIPSLMQKWVTNSTFRPTLKQRRIFEALLFGMPDIYDLEAETPNANGMGWGIMAQRIKRRQLELFEEDLV